MLHSFESSDGSYPDAGLVLASDGNFYGTTALGGSGDCSDGCGTVFKMAPAGAVTTLHSFDYTDGYIPQVPLIQGSDGSLYGTTVEGGTYSYECSYGTCGTLFKVTTTGAFTSLHSFNGSDGAAIFAPLAQDGNGAFYGTASEGGDFGFHGCSWGCGTVFKISSEGTFAIVHKYAQNDDPHTNGFVLASDGNLYEDSDVVWKLILPTTFTTVYSFTTSSAATTPVLQGTDGLFYGTFLFDGSSYAIYGLNLGLRSSVAFVVPSGKVGQSAQILGQGLTGTTAVTFNGVAATKFSVVSDTYMAAVVPSSATTGPVVVTTPGGALTSNVSFRIIN